MTDKDHGRELRGLSETPTQRSYAGRFGRLFQSLADSPAHNPAVDTDMLELRTLAASMQEASGPGLDNPTIPAGYVYLGQFIDHDITFDPTSQLQRRNDPVGLLNFRTPRFDLDSVYGSGPDDDPFQYDQDGPHEGRSFLIDPGPDMPRNRQGRALIGDPRNDENGIVSQLHVAFLLLHNRLMDDALTSTPEVNAKQRFKDAQRSAQWHYQWVVVHDFLPRIIGTDLHRQLLTRQPAPAGQVREAVHLRYYRHKANPYLPVEFSVAAYRYGHSQVRDSYSINKAFDRRLFDPAGPDFDFRGFRPLRSSWQASWPFFFELDDVTPQFSRAIDVGLTPTLSTLQGATGDGANLPLLNLQRGAALGLPSGEAVAREMGLQPLSADEVAPATAERTPLWYYILREAQLKANGQHLGPVGGRIVGETLLGLLRADPESYFTVDSAWTPTLATQADDPTTFSMADLLRYATPDQAVRT